MSHASSYRKPLELENWLEGSLEDSEFPWNKWSCSQRSTFGSPSRCVVIDVQGILNRNEDELVAVLIRNILVTF